MPFRRISNTETHPDVFPGTQIEDGVQVESFSSARSSQDEQILHAMLLDERRRLSRLEVTINRLTLTLNGLYKERDNCVIRMNQYSVALSPHRLLPPEILSNIFVFSMGSRPTELQPRSSDLPWVLLRVCSRWRQIALAEHRLWNHLHIMGSQPEPVRRAISAWIPRLWGHTQKFPVSLNLVTSDDDIALHNVLSPYSKRIRSLSLHISARSLAEFLISPPAPFQYLTSLVLNFSFGVPSNMRLLGNIEGPPPAVFAASPRLREVTFTANTINAIRFHSAASYLPWPQLTHITFHMVRVGLHTLESILRQCTKLIALTFTSLNEEYEASVRLSMPEIHLPDLRSITLISDNSTFASSIFGVVRAPLMEKFTLKHMERRYYGSRALWDYSQLLDMLSRSGARLRYLNLSCRLGGIAVESLFPALPHLVTLLVSESNPIPDSIFDMMARGEAFQTLEHLECSIFSPTPFLRFLKSRIETRRLGKLSSAIVTYKDLTMPQAIGEWIDRYADVRLTLENDGKTIVLNAMERNI